MRWNFKSTTLWIAMAVSALLFIPAVIFAPRQELFEFMNAVVFAAATGVCVGYWRLAWVAVRLPAHRMSAPHMIILSVFVVCFAIAGIFAGQWLWRAYDKPDWIIDSAALAFLRWLLAIGLISTLLTNWSQDGIITIGAYRRTALLVTVSIIAAAVLIGFGLG